MSRRDADFLSRDEYLLSCKTRAAKLLDVMEPVDAFTVLAKDLDEHPDTRHHAGVKLGLLMISRGKLRTKEEMAKFIDGFR